MSKKVTTTTERTILKAELLTTRDKHGNVVDRELVINGDRLMGAAEVGDCLGVRVQNMQFIKDLPLPADHIRASRVWLGHEVRPFAETYQERRRTRAVTAA